MSRRYSDQDSYYSGSSQSFGSRRDSSASYRTYSTSSSRRSDSDGYVERVVYPRDNIGVRFLSHILRGPMAAEPREKRYRSSSRSYDSTYSYAPSSRGRSVPPVGRDRYGAPPPPPNVRPANMGPPPMRPPMNMDQGRPAYGTYVQAPPPGRMPPIVQQARWEPPAFGGPPRGGARMAPRPATWINED